jgi:hypothetical protein
MSIYAKLLKFVDENTRLEPQTNRAIAAVG